jgi:hypothetical protein
MVVPCEHMLVHILVTKKITNDSAKNNTNDVSWMKNEYKLHINAIDISTWCTVMSFGTKVLYNLFNAIREICSYKCHLKLKN